MLEETATVVRERVEQEREVRAVTAQGRLSGWVVGGLVPVSAVILLLPHLDPVWRPAILGALACLSAAFVLAHLLAGRVAVPGRLLGSASLLYLLGWLGLVIGQAGAGAYRIWAAVGVVMFIALTLRWLTDVDAADVAAAPRQAASLYLLGLNVTIALALTLGLTGG